MSQFDKLLQRIKALDNNLRFDEIRKVYVIMTKEAIESEEQNEENS